MFLIKHPCSRILATLPFAGMAFFVFLAQAAGNPRSSVEGVIAINDVPVSGAVVYLEKPGKISPPGGGKPVTIQQKGKQFEPAFTIITLGTPIHFENHDNEIHNIQSRVPPNRFDTGAHMPGTVREVTFKNPGAVPLRCRTHENMKATVFVSPTPFYAVSDKNGGYRIPDIPAGDFRISAWHPRLTQKEQKEGAQDLILSDGSRLVTLSFTAQAREGKEASDATGADWTETVREIREELNKTVSLWEKGKKTAATRRIMSALSKLYGESGFKKAIEDFYDADRAAGYEKRFDSIRKQVQGLAAKTPTEAGLRQEAEHLTRDLLSDAEEMTKDLPRQIHR
ncbi:MAG TPA: hypothetical protein VLB09_07295 [Nitrospiria bacterium]|nr:hypothetical protein [Nitrospiria bacterium]